jgi:hypothetical protein
MTTRNALCWPTKAGTVTRLEATAPQPAHARTPPPPGWRGLRRRGTPPFSGGAPTSCSSAGGATLAAARTKRGSASCWMPSSFGSGQHAGSRGAPRASACSCTASHSALLWRLQVQGAQPRWRRQRRRRRRRRRQLPPLRAYPSLCRGQQPARPDHGASRRFGSTSISLRSRGKGSAACPAAWLRGLPCRRIPPPLPSLPVRDQRWAF